MSKYLFIFLPYHCIYLSKYSAACLLSSDSMILELKVLEKGIMILIQQVISICLYNVFLKIWIRPPIIDLLLKLLCPKE